MNQHRFCSVRLPRKSIRFSSVLVNFVSDVVATRWLAIVLKPGRSSCCSPTSRSMAWCPRDWKRRRPQLCCHKLNPVRLHCASPCQWKAAAGKRLSLQLPQALALRVLRPGQTAVVQLLFERAVVYLVILAGDIGVTALALENILGWVRRSLEVAFCTFIQYMA